MVDDVREEFSRESDEFLEEISNFGGSSFDLLEDIDVEELKKIEEVEERLEKFHRSVRDDLERIGGKVVQCEEVNAYLRQRLKEQPYLASGEISQKCLEHVRLSNELFKEVRSVLKPLNDLLGVSSRWHRSFHDYYIRTKQALDDLEKNKSKYPLKEGECCPAERNEFQIDLTLRLKDVINKYLKADKNTNIGIYNLRNVYEIYDAVFKLLCSKHKAEFLDQLKELEIPIDLFHWEKEVRDGEEKEKYFVVMKEL